jgi:hypothetical protein
VNGVHGGVNGMHRSGWNRGGMNGWNGWMNRGGGGGGVGEIESKPPTQQA